MTGYARFRATDLPKAVGVDADDGRRRADGRAGHLCHGPYLTLGPGRYAAGFYVRREPDDSEGEVEIDVCAESGRRVFARRTMPIRQMFARLAGLVHVDFIVEAVAHGCELRLRVPALARVEVREAILFRRDSAFGGRR